MAVQSVLFVHGYSETSLGAYFDFPRILSAAASADGAAGLAVEQIVLSAFNSLDDHVSISDLAVALETHVAGLEGSAGWDIGHTAVICHSTGALVVRRWLLDRANAAGALPSHLITIAGANHGSTLAPTGKSVLGYVQKALADHVLSVGERVLTDLDYGSDFLLALNAEWLAAVNGGPLKKLYAFSLGGDSLGGDRTTAFLWQTHEPGSDGIVRLSGANLNYTLVETAPGTNPPSLRIAQPQRPVPHLILAGYSHFGPATGILGNVHAPTDPPMAAVLQALRVESADDYLKVAADWSTRTAEWTAAHPQIANATLVFSLFERDGRPIDDCFIGILDKGRAADPASALASGGSCILPHSPIHNDVQRASYSFYLNYAAYLTSSPHLYHIEAHSGSELIAYKPVDYEVAAASRFEHLIFPNEFTYVRVELERDAADVYALYRWTPGLDLASLTWMPFPQQGRIALKSGTP